MTNGWKKQADADCERHKRSQYRPPALRAAVVARIGWRTRSPQVRNSRRESQPILPIVRSGSYPSLGAAAIALGKESLVQACTTAAWLDRPGRLFQFVRDQPPLRCCHCARRHGHVVARCKDHKKTRDPLHAVTTSCKLIIGQPPVIPSSSNIAR